MPTDTWMSGSVPCRIRQTGHPAASSHMHNKRKSRPPVPRIRNTRHRPEQASQNIPAGKQTRLQAGSQAIKDWGCPERPAWKSALRPCCMPHLSSCSESTGSGRVRDASSASSANPQRRSKSTTSCLLCGTAITKPLSRPGAIAAQVPGGRLPCECVASSGHPDASLTGNARVRGAYSRRSCAISWSAARARHTGGFGAAISKMTENTRMIPPMPTSTVRAERTRKWPLMPTRKRTLAR